MAARSKSKGEGEMPELKDWVKERGIGEIECLIPDINGVLRGKVFPAAKLIQSEKDGSLRLPSSVFSLTVTGEYASHEDDEESHQDPDMSLRPDLQTICVAPGFKTPTAWVFADAHHPDGTPWASSPRHVLKAVLSLYEERGWRPVVAPELEFYLTAPNADPDLPLTPPLGRSGRSETAPQPYGLEAINEYEDLIETIYEYSEAASLNLDTMIHESGTAQLEINFLHGDPILLADQVLVFKRIVRQVALKHGVYATFMAKPMENQPGSAMHLHISVVESALGGNLFADEGRDRQRDVQVLHRRPPTLPAKDRASVRSKRQLLSAHASKPQRSHQCTVGVRQPILRLAGADLRPPEPKN